MLATVSVGVVHADPPTRNQVHRNITKTLYRCNIKHAKWFNDGGAHANKIFALKLGNKNSPKEMGALLKPRPFGDVTPDGTGQERSPMNYVAYWLNRRLKMDIVPPTAYVHNRDVPGMGFVHEGAITYKAKNAKNLRTIAEKHWGVNPTLFKSDVRILDIMLRANDRHDHQVIMAQHWFDGIARPMVVDFGAGNRPGADVSLDSDGLHHFLTSFNGGKVRNIRKRTLDEMKTLTFGELKAEFSGGFLSDGEMGMMIDLRNGIADFFNRNPSMIVNDNN